MASVVRGFSLPSKEENSGFVLENVWSVEQNFSDLRLERVGGEMKKIRSWYL